MKAKLKDIQKDMQNNYIVSFATKDKTAVQRIYENLSDTELDLDVDKAKNKRRRSLDANAYCWVLCSKIATELATDKDSVYESMIQKYGLFDEDTQITILSHVPIEKLGAYHWKFIRESSDGRFKAYIRIRGSSEYNNKEMSRFLQCVVDEAKELGIETMTPLEIERLKQLWQSQ